MLGKVYLIELAIGSDRYLKVGKTSRNIKVRCTEIQKQLSDMFGDCDIKVLLVNEVNNSTTFEALVFAELFKIGICTTSKLSGSGTTEIFDYIHKDNALKVINLVKTRYFGSEKNSNGREYLTENFTQIVNSILNDKDLSWKAKGLYSYMYSKHDGWEFSIRGLVLGAKDGRDSTIAALNELLDNGWVVRHKKRVNGKFSYDYSILVSKEKQ